MNLSRLVMKFLSQKDMIEAGVTDMAKCIDVMEEAFSLLGKGDYVMGGSTRNSHGQRVWFPKEPAFEGMPKGGPDQRFMSLPGYLGGRFKVCGNKWYGSNVHNPRKHGLPRSILTMTLNDAETARPLAIMEANILSGMRTGAVVGLSVRYLAKGIALMGAAKLTALKAKVPVYNKVTGLAAHGKNALARVTAASKGSPLAFDVATLLVHEGVIPNTSLLRQAGCRHVWNPLQRYWHPKTDVDGRTNQERIFVAGDGAFVHGGEPARIKGHLAALAIAREMRCFTQAEYERQAAPIRKKLSKELLPRPFVDEMYRPKTGLYQVTDDTLVCRCEGVTAGRIRELVAQGFTDHNEIKSIVRCGMGPCQGRMCGPALVEIVAAAAGNAPEDNRPLRIRPPVKPVTLAELANAQLGGDDEK